jgi:hypothetical protein
MKIPLAAERPKAMAITLDRFHGAIVPVACGSRLTRLPEERRRSLFCAWIGWSSTPLEHRFRGARLQLGPGFPGAARRSQVED